MKKYCKVCGYEAENGIEVCPVCHQNIFYPECNLSLDDLITITDVSKDEAFLQAMIALKEKDIIEYELKMSQFRNQASQQEQTKVQSKPSNQPKCPRCNSTAITAGQRGYSIVWGFFGSGNTVNRCSNCGHKWKP